MSDDFAIGLGRKDGPAGSEPLPESPEILDNAIVDDRHAVRCMRMRIAFRRRAMRCPARMANTDRTVERPVVERLFEIEEFAFRAPSLDFAMRQRCDAGAVVAAIFEPLQCLEDNRGNGLRSDDADNSAHVQSPEDAFLMPSFFARKAAAQPGFSICRPRATASASALTSFVTTLPEPR